MQAQYPMNLYNKFETQHIFREIVKNFKILKTHCLKK